MRMLFAGLVLLAGCQDPICMDSGVVAEILELCYRDAIILLTDGRVVRVNQATLKPGDAHCLHYGNRWER